MNKGKLNYLLACSSYTFRPGIFLLTHTYIIHTYIQTHTHTRARARAHTRKRTYRASQEEWTKLRESVPYVELYRYNPKHLYPKLNGYGDNGQQKVWASGVSTYCTPSMTPYSSNAHARQRDATR